MIFVHLLRLYPPSKHNRRRRDNKKAWRSRRDALPNNKIVWPICWQNLLGFLSSFSWYPTYHSWSTRAKPRCFWATVPCLCVSQSSMPVQALIFRICSLIVAKSAKCFSGWATWDILDLNTSEELAQLSLRLDVTAPPLPQSFHHKELQHQNALLVAWAPVKTWHLQYKINAVKNLNTFLARRMMGGKCFWPESPCWCYRMFMHRAWALCFARALEFDL